MIVATDELTAHPQVGSFTRIALAKPSGSQTKPKRCKSGVRASWQERRCTLGGGGM